MDRKRPSSLFSQNLKRIRKALGITQDELAEKCGKSKNYISQLEMGTRFPSGTTLDVLCRETGYEAYEFFLDQSEEYKIAKLDRNELALMDSLKKLVENYHVDPERDKQDS